MSSGSKSQTVGYKYFMGVQLAVCHGPVDAVLELIGGDRSAWTGNVTSSGSITINQEELFGGTSREGGWAGTIDICMGEDTQEPNAYLVSKTDGVVPGYVGLLTTVFRQFYWSAMNPYFKAPWWRVRRILKGWSRGAAWYPEKAQIGRDMNPAHIIYQCLTDTEWGMGYSPDDIDDASFRAAADKLYSEGFGLSWVWEDQSSIEDVVQLFVNHINAAQGLDMETGRFVLILIRDDYDVASLPELKPSNILSLDSFQRVAWGDTANEIVVTYTDRDQNDATVSVQDPASIAAQGAVVSATRSYPAIREFDLAVRVAMRDLNVASAPLAKVTLTVNRVAGRWMLGKAFKLSWPRLGINGVPFRITAIRAGSLTDGSVEIEALEDIFGLPSNAYTGQQPSGWVEPLNPPAPAIAARAIEAPYWDLVHQMSAADIAYLEPGFGFGGVLAVKPTADSYGFDLWEAPANAGPYSFMSAGDFVASGTLAEAMPIGAGPVTFTLRNMIEIDEVDLGTYFYIDNEAFGVTAVNPSTGVVIASRAVLDTVPAAHAADARVWFVGQSDIYDPTQRTSAEVAYYKPLTRTGRGTLPLASSPAYSVTMANRATRPYPPGNVKVNSAYFPAKVYGDLAVTWSHRDRNQQTVDLVPFTSGNIGPEVGTTYSLQVFDGTTLKRTYTGITSTSWLYTLADVTADGVLQTPRLVLTSSRDGLASWQRHDITIDRHGLGFHLGEDLGGVAA